jgi:hypothetical protein
VNAGVQLQHLGQQVAIPVSWVDLPQLRATLVAHFDSLVTDYRCQETLAVPHSDSVIDEFLSGSHIDFAYLLPSQQQQVLTLLAGSSSHRAAFSEANPWLEASLSRSEGDYHSLIDANARVVEKTFSLATFGPKLKSVYQAILDGTPGDRAGQEVDGAQILAFFLNPRRLYPVRLDHDQP